MCKFLKIFFIIVSVFLMSVTNSFAVSDISIMSENTGYTSIIIKGEDNIKAYEDAGIIKCCPEMNCNETVYSLYCKVV